MAGAKDCLTRQDENSRRAALPFILGTLLVGAGTTVNLGIGAGLVVLGLLSFLMGVLCATGVIRWPR